MILISSEFFLNSELWGFKPKIANLGFFLIFFLNHNWIVFTLFIILFELIFLETFFISICVVTGDTYNFLFLINIISELSLMPHFADRYSVTPMFDLFNNFLF